jgi:hypothetical protein
MEVCLQVGFVRNSLKLSKELLLHLPLLFTLKVLLLLLCMLMQKLLLKILDLLQINHPH